MSFLKKREVLRKIKNLFIFFVFILFFRTFLFDIYSVPTSSMSETINAGNYILINKINYSIKIPMSINDIPFLNSFFIDKKKNKKSKLYLTLIKFKDYKREDMIVFNSLNYQSKYSVKRIIGLPGDSLEINNSKVIVNKNILNEKKSYKFNYKFKLTNYSSSVIKNISNEEYSMLIKSEKEILYRDLKKKKSEKIESWTIDNFGPVLIPKKGLKIKLDNKNILIYEKIIKKYENEIHIKKNENYIFKNNYFFVLGDNRHNSIDSRIIGFIPENFILGKVIKVF